MTENTTNKLAITIDIEDWYHIPSVCGSPFSVYKNVDDFFGRWDERYDYLTEPTHRVLKLLDENNIKATFFVVADVTQHYPGLIESIAEAGHEIACHGLHHNCKIDPKTKQPLFNPTEFKERTLQAKLILEKASGQRVVGYRAPNALISGWMIETLQKIGFQYDSSVSVNSLYNKTDSSLDGVSSHPYYTKHSDLEPGTERAILEFPWSYYDICGFKLPTSGGPMLRFLGANILLNGLEQSLKRGHTIFYFHPIDISHEKFPNIGKSRPLYWIIKGKIVENRIRYIFNQFSKSSIHTPIRTLREIHAEGGF